MASGGNFLEVPNAYQQTERRRSVRFVDEDVSTIVFEPDDNMSRSSSISNLSFLQIENDRLEIQDEMANDEQKSSVQHWSFRRPSKLHSLLWSDNEMSESDSSLEENEKKEEIDHLLNCSPDSELGLLALMRLGKWKLAEDLLTQSITQSIHRKDPRINAVDPVTGETPLIVACKNKRYLVTQRLCTLGASVNRRSGDRRTALHYAAAIGQFHFVKLVMTFNADPNIIGGEDNQLPLHIAAMKKQSLKTSLYLLEHGLKTSVILRDALGNIPAVYAIHSGSTPLLRELLKHHVEEQLQWRSEISRDALVHLVCLKKNVEALQLIGRAGADVNAKNRSSETPLHIATRNGDFQMIRTLNFFKANGDLTDNKDRTPLHIAASNGMTEIANFLIDRFNSELNLRTKNGSTMMHLAAEQGYADTVSLFIKLGLPVNMANKAGTRCLHIAAQNGHTDVVKLLIENGSNLEARTRDNYTALHLAVINNQPGIIKLLIGMGAKVDVKGGHLGETPLHLAAKSMDCFFCADGLLTSGANVNLVTYEVCC